jgi:hypothetical protein
MRGRNHLPGFAIVGMAAMVGGGTGAAMTAVSSASSQQVADSVALGVRPYTSINGNP